MSTPEKHLYEFGPYRLDPQERLLCWQDTPVALEPKVFDTLLMFVEHSGKLLGKEELLQRIWPDTFVEEINLARNISTLRKVLEPGFSGQPCIQTVPKYGYRFVAPVCSRVISAAENGLMPMTEDAGEPADILSVLAPSSDAAAFPAHTLKFPRRHFVYGLLGLMFCLMLVGFWQMNQSRQATPPHPIKSIAVLPFKPLDAASREPHLEIGVADTLITRLSYLGELTVRPTSAIRAYAERNLDALAAGRELTVDAILEGSLQREGERLRTTVRLLRVSDGQPLWAYQCDTDYTDIFEAQDTVSLRVAAALRSHLSTEEQQQLTKRGTNDFAAYQLYLKGQYFFNQRTAESFRKAIDAHQQAIARDPGYALAYNGLAMAQKWLLEVSGKKDAAGQDYRANLRRAAALDPTLPEVHAALGLLAQNEEWDWTQAESEYQEAIKRNPNYATAHHWYGEYLFLMGRHEAGLRELRRALEIDPLSLIINSDLAKCYVFAGQYDAAIQQARYTLELDPNFIEPHYWLCFAYYLQGRNDEALAVAEQVRTRDQRLFATSQKGMILAAQGKRDEARQILAELQQAERTRQVEHVLFATIYQALGDKEHALQRLEQSYQAHEANMICLRAAFWDGLRSEPRFQALQKKMRFPD